MTADELLKALAELTEAAQELKQMPSNESLKGYIADGLQRTLGALGVTTCPDCLTQDLCREAKACAIKVGREDESGVAAVEAPSTKPCPECSGGSPGLVDDGSGGFATCEECGGTGRVPPGVGGTDGR